jgi:hypothetical protein
MSKIKEELIGYERNPWYSDDWHVKIDELTEYELYAMTVAEMQEKARQAVKHDYYNTPRDAVLQKYDNMTGGNP